MRDMHLFHLGFNTERAAMAASSRLAGFGRETEEEVREEVFEMLTSTSMRSGAWHAYRLGHWADVNMCDVNM